MVAHKADPFPHPLVLLQLDPSAHPICHGAPDLAPTSSLPLVDIVSVDLALPDLVPSVLVVALCLPNPNPMPLSLVVPPTSHSLMSGWCTWNCQSQGWLKPISICLRHSRIYLSLIICPWSGYQFSETLKCLMGRYLSSSAPLSQCPYKDGHITIFWPIFWLRKLTLDPSREVHLYHSVLSPCIKRSWLAKNNCYTSLN